MPSQDFIQELSRKAAALFPAAAGMQKELQGQMEALLQKNLGRLNLVTREEFDAQLALLQRTETAIAELDEKVRDLEQALAEHKPGA